MIYMEINDEWGQPWDDISTKTALAWKQNILHKLAYEVHHKSGVLSHHLIDEQIDIDVSPNNNKWWTSFLSQFGHSGSCHLPPICIIGGSILLAGMVASMMKIWWEEDGLGNRGKVDKYVQKTISRFFKVPILLVCFRDQLRIKFTVVLILL